MGIIFQQYNLIRVLTVRENIELQMRLDHKIPDASFVEYILNKLGLKDVQDKYPDQISGGQKQRVAIGRALLTKPMLLLADEPTGNLDSSTGIEIMNLIKEISKESKQTIILITHDNNVARYADRVINIKDGTILER
ncbi:ATP-binding cassette domain-containing protein [Peptostreptococcus canis]|uniref:ATP-binding cassette domain-containing protein n=1 Tax=Peptostreptococcus canis TaxID=1159213 RepID=A0ABR6TLT5_9FIRM|nr:ATP-binding cassette domain-containing protein [Peptostreptococcus canis]MBP1998354.1 ABC-type lipoprotein export system ATPase subunit [Peptostreptococcus canis]